MPPKDVMTQNPGESEEDFYRRVIVMARKSQKTIFITVKSRFNMGKDRKYIDVLPDMTYESLTAYLKGFVDGENHACEMLY